MKPYTPKRIFEALKLHYYKKFGTPKQHAAYLYASTFGKKINWHAPEDLNQWINFLEFHTDTTEWSRLADKFAVREFVEQKGFKDTLIPLLNSWENPDEISFETLPNQFVLKLNNGSGDVRIIRDKDTADLFEIKQYFKKLINYRFGTYTAEPHYCRIKPRVIAEELLDISQQVVPSTSLIDYKFWCFNGVPDRCFICCDRTKEHFTIDLYTANDAWKRIDNGNLLFDTAHRQRPPTYLILRDLTKCLLWFRNYRKGFRKCVSIFTK